LLEVNASGKGQTRQSAGAVNRALQTNKRVWRNAKAVAVQRHTEDGQAGGGGEKTAFDSPA